MLAAGEVPSPQPPFSSLALYFLQAELFPKTRCLVLLSFFRRNFPPMWSGTEVLAQRSAELWSWKCNFCYFSHWLQLNT